MSNYPQAPQGCLSLRRYFHNQPSGSQWVAGQVQLLTSSELQLFGQGHHLRLKCVKPLENISEGDHIAVKIDKGEVVAVQQLTPHKPGFQASRLSSTVAESYGLFLVKVREFFRQRALVEVNTPSLVMCPGMEPELEPFATSFQLGSKSQDYFLPTSPELHLKKLLASGYTDIFEIKTCYRNGELSDHHQPEFQMLEWYRAFSDLDLIKEDLRALVKLLSDSGFIKGEAQEIKSLKLWQVFSELCDFNLKPTTNREELAGLCERHKIYYSKNDSWNDLFHLLFLTLVEPQLKGLGPVFLSEFPPSQAALARINAEGWADRFEFYWRGLEIANAFHELNDPVEQRRRFENDFKERATKERTEVPIDEEFIKALESGLPPSAGIALGLERLFIACINESDLARLRSFPVMN